MASSSNKRELKDTFIRGCKTAAPGTRAYYWDTKVQGFGLQVTDKGAKSYILYARVPPSWVPTRRRIGDATKMTLAAARRMAQEWVQLVAEGKDPAVVQRAHAQVTFGKQRDGRPANIAVGVPRTQGENGKRGSSIKEV